MKETTIKLDRITAMARSTTGRHPWAFIEIVMALLVAQDEVDPQESGVMGTILALAYASIVAVYFILPELAEWLNLSTSRTDVEESGWYAMGLSLAIGGVFVVLHVIENMGRTEYSNDTFDPLLFLLGGGPWFFWPRLPQIIGSLHVTVNQRRIKAKTSYFSRSLDRRWTETARLSAPRSISVSARP